MQKFNNKSKLRLALQLNKKPIDPKIIDAKDAKNLRKFNEKPVTSSSAERLVSQILSRPITDKVGPHFPLGQMELDKIFEERNIRLNYKLLGTSGSQLQDSLIVDQDVTKFLARGDVPRAIKLMEMARHQGGFALGTIVKHLIQEGRVNESFDLIGSFKKRGININGRLLNILISDYADAVSSKKVERSDIKVTKLLKLVENEIKRGNESISTIHVNSLMKLFRKSKHPELSYHFYNFIRERKTIKPDLITYTELFRNIANIIPSEDISYIDLLNATDKAFFTVQHEPRIKIDSHLIFAYVTIFAYSDEISLQAKSITIMREWFRLSTLDDIKNKINYKTIPAPTNPGPKSFSLKSEEGDQLRLLTPDLMNAKKTLRFIPDNKVLKLYEQQCLKFNISFVYKPQL